MYGGSSPRVRGTRVPHRLRADALRIIPARAGNAPRRSPPPFVRADHPRACGERDCRVLNPHAVHGSSPRVRGTLIEPPAALEYDRIIPARAGNASPPLGLLSWAPDHPRACGERGRSHVSHRLTTGSSPRVRGTPDRRRTRPLPFRIIPARAGNARRESVGGCGPADHPRACGERSDNAAAIAAIGGSSPRVRGTQCLLDTVNADRRIIPARAGNAPAAGAADGSATDHPRACGERWSVTLYRGLSPGSSPRVRGTRRRYPPARLFIRIIPARAGNAPTTRRPPGRGPDHPRACGERSDFAPRFVTYDGSSPRVRGTRRRRPPDFETRRIIPARAGNASVTSCPV